MRVKEKCSCGAKIDVIDSVNLTGFPRDSLFDLQQRMKKRIEDWRKNHNHDKKMKS